MKNRMDYFFKWLTQPMDTEDIEAWKSANNIIVEKTNLFEDFCFSLYDLISSTYLGNIEEDLRDTQIPMSHNDNLNHFNWCWNRILENFKKENIFFKSDGESYDYFMNFFFDVFYQQNDREVRDAVTDFFKQLFNGQQGWSKSDLEMFTDLYKTLDRSLQI